MMRVRTISSFALIVQGSFANLRGMPTNADGDSEFDWDTRSRQGKFKDLRKRSRSLLLRRILDGLFEGDIKPDYDSIVENYGIEVAEELEAEGILSPTHEGVHSENEKLNDVVLQNVVLDRRWNTRVNDIVQVPYVLDSSYSLSQVSQLKGALQDLGNRSKVVKFVPRRNEFDYVKVEKWGGCASYVGKQGGEQELNLSSGCVSRKGVIQHEFMHALGLFHEQSRPDRDDFIRVNYENIDSGREHNFRKKSSLSTLGNSYDYGSVMHYPDDAFSSNGKDTLTPLKPLNGKVLGQRRQADFQDILDIQLLYQCRSGPRTLSEYNSNRCTPDCKCWEGQIGCNRKDNACQGSLVCRNNRCVTNNGGYRGTNTSSPTKNRNRQTFAPSRERKTRTSAPTRSVNRPNRKWELIKNRGDCLSVNKNNGNNVVIWRCYSGNNQKWFYNQRTKTIQNMMKGKLCLTWNNDGNQNYNVKVQGCTGERNQKWHIDETVSGSMMTLRTEIGGCLSKDSKSRFKVKIANKCTFALTQQFEIINP